jgi:hypothetical protein
LSCIYHYQSPFTITNHHNCPIPLPITIHHYQSPITNHQSPITNHHLPITITIPNHHYHSQSPLPFPITITITIPNHHYHSQSPLPLPQSPLPFPITITIPNPHYHYHYLILDEIGYTVYPVYPTRDIGYIYP